MPPDARSGRAPAPARGVACYGRVSACGDALALGRVTVSVSVSACQRDTRLNTVCAPQNKNNCAPHNKNNCAPQNTVALLNGDTFCVAHRITAMIRSLTRWGKGFKPDRIMRFGKLDIWTGHDKSRAMRFESHWAARAHAQ